MNATRARAELRAMNEDELDDRLSELHREWQDLRFQDAIGNLTATARTREIRKSIARIHTIRSERERETATRALLAEQRTPPRGTSTTARG